MKTPQEIAAEIAPNFPGLNDPFMAVFQGWIAAGIEADRAQFAVADNQVRFVVDFDSAAWRSLDTDGRAAWINRVVDAINDEAYVSRVDA